MRSWKALHETSRYCHVIELTLNGSVLIVHITFPWGYYFRSMREFKTHHRGLGASSTSISWRHFEVVRQSWLETLSLKYTVPKRMKNKRRRQCPRCVCVERVGVEESCGKCGKASLASWFMGLTSRERAGRVTRLFCRRRDLSSPPS